MKILLWSLLALFLIGNAVFVLPLHVTSDSVTTHYDINYRKDSSVLKRVFADKRIRLSLNLPTGYQAMYEAAQKKTANDSAALLLVNVSVFHNLDFTALSFPFFKLTSFNGVIPFYSIIKADNAPDMDSTVLVGNIVVNGKISIKGIASPTYARAVVEKELVAILKKEMDRIAADINRPPDTTQQILLPPPVPARSIRKGRK